MRPADTDCLNSGSCRAKIIQKCIGASPARGAPGRSTLAFGAIVGSAPGYHDPANRRFAAAAWLASAQVDAVLKLKKPALAIGVDVIGDRRAAQPNSMRQDLAQRGPQAVELGAR